MKYLRSLSTQTKANLSNLFSLCWEKYPFHRPLRASSILDNFAIHRSLVTVFITTINFYPRLFRSSHTCTEAKYLSTLTTRRCLFTHVCKILIINLVPCKNSIIFFRIMKIFFRRNLDNIQLNHYSRNTISSIMDLTTNCNILWQTSILQCPPISYHMDMDSSTQMESEGW